MVPGTTGNPALNLSPHLEEAPSTDVQNRYGQPDRGPVARQGGEKAPGKPDPVGGLVLTRPHLPRNLRPQSSTQPRGRSWGRGDQARWVEGSTYGPPAPRGSTLGSAQALLLLGHGPEQ